MNLNKKEKALLGLASRPCGSSYRASCSRGIEDANKLKDMGLIILRENKNKLIGRFTWFATEEGLNQCK